MKNKILALLAVAAVGSVAAAQTDGTTVSAEITPVLALTISENMALTPTLGTPDSGTSDLTFVTNSGSMHSIDVVASAWTGLEVGTSTEVPVLTFVSVTSADATSAGGGTVLIPTTNMPANNLDILTGVDSVDGVGTVTLSAAITPEVDAGIYTSTVTYTISPD